MWKTFELGVDAPVVGGDFEYKSVFALFTTPPFALRFTRQQCRVFERHVSWTRLLKERRKRSPATGREELRILEGAGFDFPDVFTVAGIFPSRCGCNLLGRLHP